MQGLVGSFRSSAKNCTIAMLLGAACTPSLMGSAKADAITDQIIQNTVQNILQNVRDQIQRRDRLPVQNRVMRFSGEEANVSARFEEPFAALGYAGLPRKAPPMAAPVAAYLFGANLSGSVDTSYSSGVRTNSVSGTGAIDITKIGVFETTDAVSVIFTGSGIFSSAPGLESTTSVGAGTIAYVNGNFSTDFTVNGQWTRAQLAAVGIGVAADSSAVSYAPNVQYKFDMGNTWFFEPTVGFTYTETYTANFGAKTGESTEVRGGARVGFETMWDAVRVQPTLSVVAFSIVNATPAQANQVGVRASGKLNFVWTDKFSSFIEAHGSGIANTTAFGGMGGLRWTF